MGFKDLLPITYNPKVPEPIEDARWTPPARREDTPQAYQEAILRATHEAGYQKGRADTLEKKGTEHNAQMFQLARDLINRPVQVSRTLHQTWHRPANRGGHSKASWYLLYFVIGVISLIAVASSLREFFAHDAPPPAAAAAAPNINITVNPTQPGVARRLNSY